MKGFIYFKTMAVYPLNQLLRKKYRYIYRETESNLQTYWHLCKNDFMKYIVKIKWIFCLNSGIMLLFVFESPVSFDLHHLPLKILHTWSCHLLHLSLVGIYGVH